jgi:hypothetical protein
MLGFAALCANLHFVSLPRSQLRKIVIGAERIGSPLWWKYHMMATKAATVMV